VADDFEIVSVPANQSVQDMVDLYAAGEIDYRELEGRFRDQGWSTLSLFENVCHIEVKK